MKYLVAFLVLLTVASAQPAPTPPFTPTDPEAQEILRLSQDQSALKTPGATPRERRLAYDAANRAWFQRALTYVARQTAGPDRAELILVMTVHSPEFITAIDPAFDQNPDLVYFTYDEAAKAGFREEAKALLRTVRDDATATADQHVRASRFLLLREIEEAKTAAQLDTLQAEIDHLAAGGLDERSLQAFQSRMFHPYESMGMDVYAAYLDRVVRSDHPVIRRLAEEARAKFTKTRAMVSELKFTAVDGREVDIDKLKGKVVLVDFWATWCGPCIAELPQVKKAYAAYHDQGFEIIGIAFENAGLVTEADVARLRSGKPNAKADTPEEATRKLEAARANLRRFTAEHGMPWPHHFDGKFWKNDIGVRFGIGAIPAMLLIDRNGRLVSTNVGGKNLETEVKRLLGL